MRHLAAATLLLALAPAGCAGRRGPTPTEGPRLTIHNDAHYLLDLSYSCATNGPLRRLGTVEPLSSETFALEPASCPVVHLVEHPVNLDLRSQRTFAVIPMLGRRSAEVVLTATGAVIRGAPDPDTPAAR